MRCVFSILFLLLLLKVLGIHFLGLYSTVALLNCGQVKLNLVTIGSGLEKNHGSQFQCWTYVFADHPRIHDPLTWHPLGGSSFKIGRAGSEQQQERGADRGGEGKVVCWELGQNQRKFLKSQKNAITYSAPY